MAHNPVYIDCSYCQTNIVNKKAVQNFCFRFLVCVPVCEKDMTMCGLHGMPEEFCHLGCDGGLPVSMARGQWGEGGGSCKKVWCWPGVSVEGRWGGGREWGQVGPEVPVLQGGKGQGETRVGL